MWVCWSHLCLPYAALIWLFGSGLGSGLDLATTHGGCRVPVCANMSNVARMHGMGVPWALSMLLCTLAILRGTSCDAHGTSAVCTLAALLILARTHGHHAPWQGHTLTPTLSQRVTPGLHKVSKGVTNAPMVCTEAYPSLIPLIKRTPTILITIPHS